MNSKNIKQKTIDGMLWSTFERFGYLSVQFMTNLVLARLLAPSEFGTIGILLIVINLSMVFVDSGLGSALIQKKHPTPNDYSTIFFTNILLAIIIYASLFFSASLIAGFFEDKSLTLLLKVIGIVIITDSLSIVQNNLLIKKLEFRKYALVKISSAAIASTVAIVCALKGFGVWSLVIQSILYSVSRTIIFWFITNWYPSLIFRWKSFNELFNYGYKLLLSTLLSRVYVEMQSAIIGKYFSVSNLGFFTQAKQLQGIPVNSLSNIVNQVSFPVYSSLQDNKNVLLNAVRKNIKALTFINFPLMTILTLIAQPLIILFYTDKWIDSVPFFQWLCMGFGTLLIVHQSNLTALKAIGRTDLVLYLEIVKKLIGVLLIIGGIKYFGIMGLLYGLTLNSILEIFLNGYFLGKEIKYGSFKQIKDFLPVLVLSISVGLIVHFLASQLVMGVVLEILFSVSLYSIIYLLLSYIFKVEGLRIYYVIIMSKIKKNK